MQVRPPKFTLQKPHKDKHNGNPNDLSSITNVQIIYPKSMRGGLYMYDSRTFLDIFLHPSATLTGRSNGFGPKFRGLGLTLNQC